MNLKESSRHATGSRPAPGFTLIELMITVAIVAILAAIAYPSYADYVRRGKRATAQAALMDVASRQQTYLLDRRVYTGTVADLGFAVPAEIAADYAFALVASAANVTPPTFSATATPSAALQSKGELTLTVNQAGARTPVATRGYWGY